MATFITVKEKNEIRLENLLVNTSDWCKSLR